MRVMRTNTPPILWYTNPEVTISHSSTLTYSSPLSSRRLRVIAIFVICMLALTLYTQGRSAKQKRHLAILDSLVWADMSPSQRCLRFGTLEYSIQLMGIPKGEHGRRCCKEKGIVIHGIDIEKPGYCTVDVGNSAPTNLRIFRHWRVNFNESSCKTLWENFQDKGCAATGPKTCWRIEAHMGNHQQPWDNWREVCSTTHADYDGHHSINPRPVTGPYMSKRRW
ncbi:hypothetical protein ARMGADRAFT_1085249 [Armillaria gallica]|uniref:Uncharacterized protein n=1 Tax=Armillaria gallica TaxID=47427 RepID=A0A2H3D2D9_ARMGA|nr:hypothetical protein ARMGADRAFT_1085249 [Armillaria gallica]